MYYPCSENKGADQLRGYREADLRLCFRIGKNPVFSRCGSNASSLLIMNHDIPVTTIIEPRHENISHMRKQTSRTQLCLYKVFDNKAIKLIWFVCLQL